MSSPGPTVDPAETAALCDRLAVALDVAHPGRFACRILGSPSVLMHVTDRRTAAGVYVTCSREADDAIGFVWTLGGFAPASPASDAAAALATWFDRAGGDRPA